MKTASILFAVLTSSSFTGTYAAKCYYPDGTNATDVPCKATTKGHSACCGKSSTCLSSGLCLDFGVVSRGSCTDPTFKDAACAEYCLNVNRNKGIPIIPRAWGPTIADFKWCCDFPNAKGECISGSTITVQAGSVVTNNTSPSPTNISGSKVATVATGVGVGVGVPLGIAVVSLLFLWLRERRRRKKTEMEVTERTTFENMDSQPKGTPFGSHSQTAPIDSHSTSETMHSSTTAAANWGPTPPFEVQASTKKRPTELNGNSTMRPELP